MTIDRLSAALADRYRIERELGQGGMATVYLAHDLKHDRKVALKVLKPELAAAIGHERFLREITTTANLRHPHILPLFDSGAAPGPDESGRFLYYVMPFIEGESLRDRLDREKQLPLEDTLRITAQVADALGYAHGRGVIHRDIKPENILLEGEHAVVADFGIARALTSAGTTSLTQAGMAIGTPAYMSPEQAAGERDLDGRSDLYSLGCVTYEMLAGQPPFTGPTVESIIHQQLGALPRPVTQLRAAIPASVSSALQRALAKAPADRFTTPSGFSAALKMEKGGAGLRLPRWTWVTAAAVVVAFGGWFALRGSRAGAPLDPDVIAVLPFRVNGDPSVSYLREAMLDLLQARLSDAAGPRTVEPRTLLAAWRHAVHSDEDDLSEESSRALARTVGAGRVLLGSAIATPGQLTLSGTLLRVQDGATLARESVVGPPDSVAILVNRLTAALLIREAGEAANNASGLASEPLDALQAYLAGQKAYRRGDYFGAMDLYAQALERDSTFAEAAFRMVVTNAWIGTVATTEGYRVLPLAWRLRDHLTPRDRDLLLSLPQVGPRYPDASTYHEVITKSDSAANAAGDSPDHWLLLGQLLAVYGAAASEPNWETRSANALDRAIALDSSFTTAIGARLFTALRADDHAGIARYYALLARQVEAGSTDDGWLWAAARALGDSAGAARWRDHVEVTNARVHRAQKLIVIPLHSVAFTLPLEDARWAVTTARREATSGPEREGAILGELALAFAEGRLDVANGEWALITGPGWRETLMQQGLIEPAYRDAAIEIVRRSDATTTASPGMRDCFGPLLRRAAGGSVDLPGTIRRLDADGPALQVCAALARALLEEGTATGPPRPALDRLDSLMHDGPRSFTAREAADIEPDAFANLTVARLRAAQGAYPAALAALRRREVDYYPSYLWSLPAFLRQEGRLAALTGDTAGARRAYDRYLVLRTDPDPVFRPQRDSVLAERATLAGPGAP